MSNRNMKSKIGILLVIVMVMASSMSALASSSFSSFSFSLPGFNGSKYTSYQKKDTLGSSGEIKNYSSGASANVDARMMDKDGETSSWTRNLNKNNTTYTMDGTSNHKAGEEIRTQFSSDITTTVAVDISGSWRCN